MDESSVQMNARRKEHNQRAKEVMATTIVSKAVEIEVRNNKLHVHTCIHMSCETNVVCTSLSINPLYVSVTSL